MPRPLSIRRLPREVQETIARLREQGRTLKEILAKLEELDIKISKSALGRHVKQIEDVGERIRKSREIAEALVQRFGDAPESKTARMNIELTHSLVTDIVAAVGGKDGSEFGPQDVMLIAKAVDHLGKAAKADADTIRKARQEAAEAAKSVVKKSGIGNEAQRKKLVEAVDKILLGAG